MEVNHTVLIAQFQAVGFFLVFHWRDDYAVSGGGLQNSAVLHGAIIHDANFFRVELGGNARFPDAFSFNVQSFLEFVPFVGRDESKNHFLVVVDVFRGDVQSPVNKGGGELCQAWGIDTF
ncbi:Uncharacterised protein [Enterobacter hormaechei]|nr:Uncharacterised protein [Enterobacter hormaechei]